MSSEPKTSTLTTMTDTQLYTIDRILKERKRGSKNEFLVKWYGYDHSNNTWEPQKHSTKEIINAFREEKKMDAKKMATYNKHKDAYTKWRHLQMQKMRKELEMSRKRHAEFIKAKRKEAEASKHSVAPEASAGPSSSTSQVGVKN